MKKRILPLITAVLLLGTMLTACAERPATLAEMAGDYGKGFDTAYVEEVKEAKTTDTYKISEIADILNMMEFLTKAEIEYVGKAGKELTFSSDTHYKVFLCQKDDSSADSKERSIELDLALDGEEIYFEGAAYKMSDKENMWSFSEILSGIEPDESISMERETGAALRESVTAYLETQRSGQGQEVAVCGDSITKEYFQMRYDLRKWVDSDSPKEKTIESIRKDALIKQLSEEYSLEPATEDVQAAIADQKDIIDSADMGTILGMRGYIEAMGLTEDEYWNEYCPESITRLIRMNNVEKYLSENNLPTVEKTLEKSDIKFEIKDQGYFDGLE